MLFLSNCCVKYCLFWLMNFLADHKMLHLMWLFYSSHPNHHIIIIYRWCCREGKPSCMQQNREWSKQIKAMLYLVSKREKNGLISIVSEWTLKFSITYFLTKCHRTGQTFLTPIFPHHLSSTSKLQMFIFIPLSTKFYEVLTF